MRDRGRVGRGTKRGNGVGDVERHGEGGRGRELQRELREVGTGRRKRDERRWKGWGKLWRGIEGQ